MKPVLRKSKKETIMLLKLQGKPEKLNSFLAIKIKTNFEKQIFKEF